MSEHGLRELLARAAITDALMRYCRGVDRRDRGLVESAYWADGTDVRAAAPDGLGPAEFAARATAALGPSDFSMHHTTNVFIDLDLERDLADVESYVLTIYPVGADSAPALRAADGSRITRLFAGRYVDRFECRDDDWRIARRHVLLDHVHEAPASLDPHIARLFRPGDVRTDPSYPLMDYKTV